MERKSFPEYLRNFVFGVEDSLVSTVGLLSGIAIADVPRETILVTGVVLIFVEAFSMAGGTFLSEYSVEEYEAHRETSPRKSFAAALVMFVSYFISGFIPLFPYTVFPVTTALILSVALSLAALFLLGAIGAKIAKVGVVRNGIRMLVIGGAAILVGVLVGQFFGIR